MNPSDAATTVAAGRAGNAPLIVAVLGLCIMLALYVFAWWSKGRAPPRGLVARRTAPPRGLSSAALRFVSRMDCDSISVVATIVGLATKGHVTIVDANDVFTLERIVQPKSTAALSRDEDAIAQALFAESATCVLSRRNLALIRQAKSVLGDELLAEFENEAYVSNYPMFVAGLVVLGLTVIATALAAGAPSDSLLPAIGVAVFTMTTAACLKDIAENRLLSVRTRWRWARHDLGLTLASAVLLAVTFYAGADNPRLLPALFVLSIQAVAALPFRHLLKKRTQSGAQLADEVEAFRLYLSTSDRDLSLEELEGILPCSVALDAEDAWQQDLARRLRQRASTERPYAPHWLKVTPARAFDIFEFVARLDRALDLAVVQSE